MNPHIDYAWLWRVPIFLLTMQIFKQYLLELLQELEQRFHRRAAWQQRVHSRQTFGRWRLLAGIQKPQREAYWLVPFTPHITLFLVSITTRWGAWLTWLQWCLLKKTRTIEGTSKINNMITYATIDSHSLAARYSTARSTLCWISSSMLQNPRNRQLWVRIRRIQAVKRKSR